MDQIIEMIDRRILELITFNIDNSVARMEELVKLKEKIVKEQKDE